MDEPREQPATPETQPAANLPAEKPLLHLRMAQLIGLLVVSILLAALLSLGVLAYLNKGLYYASPQDIQALSARADSLEARLEDSIAENEALRERVAELEDLAERTTRLEKLALEIEAEVDKRITQAEELRKSVLDIEETIGGVLTQNSGLQKFVDRVRETWTTIFPGTSPP